MHFRKQSVSLGRQDPTNKTHSSSGQHDCPIYSTGCKLAPSYPLSWDKATPTLRNHWNLLLSNACLECVCCLKTIHGGGLVMSCLQAAWTPIPCVYLWTMRCPFWLAFDPRHSRSVDLIGRLEHWGNGTKMGKKKHGLRNPPLFFRKLISKGGITCKTCQFPEPPNLLVRLLSTSSGLCLTKDTNGGATLWPVLS